MKITTSSSRFSGMTLVEVVVVVALFSMLSMTVFGFAQWFYQTHTGLSTKTESVDQARRGVTNLLRDWREMSYAENGTFPIAEIDPHKVGFFSDSNGDGVTEYLEYELVGTTLERRRHNPSGFPPVYNYTTPDEVEIISEHVLNIAKSTSTFFYYDSSGIELDNSALLSDVRYLRSQLIINVDPNRGAEDFVLRISSAPRNIKDNL